MNTQRSLILALVLSLLTVAATADAQIAVSAITRDAGGGDEAGDFLP